MHTPIHGIHADGSIVDDRQSRRAGSLRTGITVALATVAAVATLALVAAVPASASTLDGVATVTDPSGTFLASGGSATPFSVALPANAACSGDTASDGYHVYSYLVHAGTDVTTLTAVGNNPPSEGFGFVNDIGTYYGPANTAPTTGEIIGIPTDFEWAPLAANPAVGLSTLLYTAGTSGVWEAGLLCADSNTGGSVSDYWNTEVTFSASGSDPNGFTWSAVPGPSGNQLPVITSADSTGFTVGSAGTFTVTATGTPTPTLSQAGTLPTGVTFNPTTGVLSGTPAAGTANTYPISFTATSIGAPVSQNFTLTVSGPTAAPTITSANNTSFTVGSAGTFTVTATGNPTPTFAETGALPTGVSLNTTSGVLSGTPAAGTGGTYPITMTATNGVGSPANQSFTLNVNQPAAITSANNTTFTAGTAGTFTVTATGFPAPTFIETGALPSGVSLNATSGVLSGTPPAGTGGTYPITLTATNGIGSPADQPFTLTVDQAPAITSADTTGFTVGSAGTFTVTATGFPAPTFGKTGALPSGVTLSTAGVLSGTPGSGTAGSYPITITATNGIGTDATQLFTLVVGLPAAITSVNHATFTVGSAGTFTVTATGSPPPTFTETGPLPTGVSLNATSGVLSGTPAAGTGASYPITLTATNGIGTPATQTFTLTVDEAPAVTSADTTTFNVGSADSFTVTATGFPAPTFGKTGALPSGVSLSSAGVLSGTPAAAAVGSYPITITATNGIGTDATQTFTLVVQIPPLAISTTPLPAATVGTAYSQTLGASGGIGPYTWSISSGTLPAGLALDPATGTISGTPTAVGSSTFTAAVTDTQPVMATRLFTISVVAAVIPPNPGTLPGGSASGVTATPDGKGYWLINGAGDVSPHGSARSFGSLNGVPLNAPIVDLVSTPDGQGYWLVASDGGVFAFGNAPFLGSMGGQRLNAPVVGAATTGTGHGYWLVAADGGVFAFGDAPFLGSMGGQRLNAPVVGAATTGTGHGYWLVASDGGIFAFGDAPFLGSMGGQRLNQPVVGIATDGSGGYWLAASDGGVFTFGDAPFLGSAVGYSLSGPVVSIASGGTGYWLASRGGGIYAFGQSFYGGG